MFNRQGRSPWRVARAAACAVLVIGACATATADEAPRVDNKLLAKALAAPAGDLAQGYASSKSTLGMLKMAEHGITIQLGNKKVTQDNVAKVRADYETRLATYGAAIEQRGMREVAGDYAATATGCAKSGSSWAGMVESGFDKVVIKQEGPEVTLVVMGEYEGQPLEMGADGVTVEDMIALIDPMNSDYPLSGKIEDGRITIRPQADMVLRAWPGWAGPPQRADVESCVVTLQPAPAP
jgi:hypothetical protein